MMEFIKVGVVFQTWLCFAERSLTLQTCTVVLQLYILNIFSNSALRKMFLISMFASIYFSLIKEKFLFLLTGYELFHLVLVMEFSGQQTLQ